MNPNPEFDRMMGQEFPQETVAPHPYGIPAHPVKPGLTTRGKAALAAVTVVIATGGILIWQNNAADQAATQAKAQEYALKQQELRIQELKELNKANEISQKTQKADDSARQKQIDACINTDKGLVGKQLGVTYSSILKDCQAQYPATTNSADMQAAASVDDAGGSGSGGVNTGLFIGGAVLVLGVTVAAKKATRSNREATYHLSFTPEKP